MGAIGPWQLLIILAIVLLLFGGGGKIPKLMKDLGAGINSFKKGMNEKGGAKDDGEAESESEETPKTIEAQSQTTTATTTTTANGAESTTGEDRKAANG